MRQFALLTVLIFALIYTYTPPLHATIFGSVRGIIHDPQHLPVVDAQVEVRAKASSWSQTSKSDANGGFQIDAVPIGDYVVTVTSAGFAPFTQAIQVTSDSAPILHFQLSIQSV